MFYEVWRDIYEQFRSCLLVKTVPVFGPLDIEYHIAGSCSLNEHERITIMNIIYTGFQTCPNLSQFGAHMCETQGSAGINL